MTVKAVTSAAKIYLEKQMQPLFHHWREPPAESESSHWTSRCPRLTSWLLVLQKLDQTNTAIESHDQNNLRNGELCCEKRWNDLGLPSLAKKEQVSFSLYL